PVVLGQGDDSGFVAVRPEVPAEIARGASGAEENARARSVEAAKPSSVAGLEKRVVGLQRCDLRLETLRGKVAAGQRGTLCPCLAAAADQLPDLRQCGFRQLAVSGELAAEYVDEGRLAARVIALQHIFARRVLRLGRPVIIEGTHAGISPYDIGRGDGLAEIFARARAQIVDFRRRDPHVGGIAAIVEIRRTDQGEVGLVRYREKDAAVAVLEE